MKSTPKNSLQKLTLSAAAREFQLPRTTLRRFLESAGTPTPARATYTIADIHRALVADDGVDWRQRAQRARALALEDRTARDRGNLIDRAVITEVLQRGAGGLKAASFEEIQNAPMRFAAAGNDVAANREVLRTVFDRFVVRFNELFIPELRAVENHTAAFVSEVNQPTTKSTYEKKK